MSTAIIKFYIKKKASRTGVSNRETYIGQDESKRQGFKKIFPSKFEQCHKIPIHCCAMGGKNP